MTAYKIMSTGEGKGFVFYKADCACSADDHIMWLCLEYDEEISTMIDLTLYSKLRCSSFWGNKDRLQGFWFKIKTCLKLLFTGYLEVEETFIFQGEKHIREFINALEEGIVKVKND